MRIPVLNLPQIPDDRWRSMAADPIDRILRENQITVDQLLKEAETMNPIKYVSARKFAELCGVHYNTVLNWIHNGLIPFLPRPGGYLIPEDTKRPKC